MTPQFEAVRSEYAALWKGMVVRPERLREVERTARRILKERERYGTVSSATNVPWFVVGLIHAMEAGLSFDDHLHNGDPLDERTVHVPRGRPKQGNPPFTWEQSAIDALQFDGLNSVDNWCIERICYMLETYNGFGYRSQRIAIPTPYLWSATNVYTKGKYVRDGIYDPNAVSEQSGAMAILSVMRDIEPNIVLTYFNGSEAAHDPKAAAAIETGPSAKKPASAITGDVITTASAAALLTTVMAHTPAAPATPATPPATPAAPPTTTPAPSAAPVAQPAQNAAPATLPPQAAPPPATVQPAQPAPSVAHVAAHPIAGTVTSTAQPPNSFVKFVDAHYPVLLGGLAVLFVAGLVLAWRARSTHKRSAHTFETALPQLLSRIGSGDLSSAPLVQSLKARALTIAWVAATITVNVIAFAKLLQEFHLAPSNWYPPFSWLGGRYDTYAVQGFHVVSDAMAKQFGHGLDGMPWLLPFIVLYASTASAFMVANSALMKRENSAQGFWGAIVHAGWLLAVPLFLLDAVRYRVVTRFARQNSLLFVAYIATFMCLYVAARFVNDDFLAPYIRHNPGAVAAATQQAQQVQKDLVSANSLIPH